MSSFHIVSNKRFKEMERSSYILTHTIPIASVASDGMRVFSHYVGYIIYINSIEILAVVKLFLRKAISNNVLGLIAYGCVLIQQRGGCFYLRYARKPLMHGLSL